MSDHICGTKTRGDSSPQRDALTAPRFYAERSSEEPAVITFPASEDVETFEILTCGAVAMANDASGILEW